MVQQATSLDNLLNDLSPNEERFLLDMRTFCKLPILLYFYMRKKYTTIKSKEVLFYPERKDAYNKKPHRAFLFNHPEMGDLMCYLLHRTTDWFDVVIAFPEYDAKGELTVNGPLLFSMSFWSLEGVSNETTNSSYLNFNSGSEGSVSHDGQEKYFKKLKKHFNFRLEVIKMLEDCK